MSNGVSRHIEKGAVVVSGQEFYGQGRRARCGQLTQDVDAALAVAGQEVEIGNLPKDSDHRRTLSKKRQKILKKLAWELGSMEAALQMVKIVQEY